MNAWRDPNLDRKEKVMKGMLLEQPSVESADFPLVSLFEISLSGLCNRKCPFCPRHDPAKYPNVNEFIEPTLHTRLMKQLGDLEYGGLIVYSGYSEPLLHKGIEQIVAEARRFCPKAKVEIYTNGDFLTAEMAQRLFQAGLSSLLVSLYDGPEQVPHFEAMREAAGLKPQQMLLRERYKLEEGEGMHLSNRAGMIDFKEMNIAPLKESLQRPCYLPFYMMMVDHTGEVFLCSHDWIKKLVVGNLNQQTILEVWNGPRLKAARLSLSKGDRAFGPCATCDVDGVKIGGDHFRRWMEYYGK